MNCLPRILVCLLTLGSFLYLYVDKLNAHTELKLRIPQLAREIDQIKQSAAQLSYTIECFKDPAHLMQLAKNPEYSHLKFPYQEDVLHVETHLAKQSPHCENDGEVVTKARSVKLPILLGTK